MNCERCGQGSAARALALCSACLRSLPVGGASSVFHQAARRRFGLPEIVPHNPAGPRCRVCANGCRPGLEERGYCGLRKNSGGRITSLSPKRTAHIHMYFDPLPTNCCAAWFCPGSKKKGYNLAVFFYGCNFDCLFCQNHSHKEIDAAPLLTADNLIAAALRPEVRCICFFGGSPEPQLPFALEVSRIILEKSKGEKHICWEWNGCGHPALVLKAAALSSASGGTIKFDLKAFHPNLSLALCGVDNHRAYENFALLAQSFPQRDLLTATTLLVPYYVDRAEVSEIAAFISRQSKDIPYSLLVFHPDFLMSDLPVTPRGQVDECFEAASRSLSRVNLGNWNLL